MSNARENANVLAGFQSSTTVDASGTNDAGTAIASLFSTGSGIRTMQAGTYKLASNVTPVVDDVIFIADIDTAFTGAGKVDLVGFTPYQGGPGPVWANMLFSKTYGSSWLTQGNIFQIGSHVKSSVSAVPVVAIWGSGETIAAGSKAWGMNAVGIASYAGTNSIAIEVDAVCTVAGANAYGVVVTTAGAGGQAVNALQISANTLASQWVDGITFQYRATENCVSDTLINVVGDPGSGNTSLRFIRAANIRFTAAEIDLPSFKVGATPATVDGHLQIVASTGGNPKLSALATSADSNLQIQSKGAGSVQLVDGSANVRFSVDSTGVGFFGVAPVARSTGWGTPTGSAMLTNFPGATATLAQTSGTLAALLLHIKSIGLIGA